MNDYRVSRRFHVLLLTLVFAVVSAPAFAIKITLGVDVAANELTIVANDKKCQGARMNCIGPDRGSRPFINIHLPNACGGNEGDPKYKLNEMQLSMVGNTGNPGKGFGKWELPQPVFEDFNADKTTGVVKFSGPSSLADDLIKVKNKNSAEYVVFFNIKAVACKLGTIPAEITLDPRIENTG